MRITIALLALSVAASAADTKIRDTVLNPFGGYFTGTLNVSCPAAFDNVGAPISAMNQTFSIANGVFSASIHPYDTATPRYTCTAKYTTTDSAGRPVSWQQQWLVYTTTATIRIVDLVNAVTTPTSPGRVLDVFGRTGHVQAYAGDYTANQVTNAADITSSNSYLSGAKQVFRPSTFYAGVNIECAPLPSIASTGDVACDSNDVNKLKTYNGSAWVAGSGGSGGGGSAPYETDITGTSIAITQTVHGKGNYPVMYVYSAGAQVPITYTVSSGNIAATVASGTYHVKIVNGVSSTPYEANFTSVTSISVAAATHGQGQHPLVALFAGSTFVPVNPGVDVSGNISITLLASGNYHLKVY